MQHITEIHKRHKASKYNEHCALTHIMAVFIKYYFYWVLYFSYFCAILCINCCPIHVDMEFLNFPKELGFVLANLAQE